MRVRLETLVKYGIWNMMYAERLKNVLDFFEVRLEYGTNKKKHSCISAPLLSFGFDWEISSLPIQVFSWS